MSQTDLRFIEPVPAGFTPINADVVAGDPLDVALAKLQGQIDNLPTGGGGPTANVRWGPDFGQQAKPEVTVERPTLPFIRLAGAVNVAEQVRLPALSLIAAAAAQLTQTLNFAPGFALRAAGQIVMPSLAMSAIDEAQCAPRMASISMDTTQGLTAAASMSSVALAADEAVAASLSMPTLRAAADEVIQCQCQLTSTRLAHTKSAGAHLSATVLGAPLYVDVGTYSATSNLATGNFDVPVPASRQAGDLLLMMVGFYANAGVINVPSGWTDLGGQFANGILKSRCCWKISDGTEAATQNVTLVGSGAVVAEVHVVRAVNQSAPINVPAQATTASVTDPVAPSLTTTVANTLVFYWVVHDHGALPQSHTPPASNTERAEHESSGLSVRVINGNSGTRYFAAAGATGTATIDCNELTATAAISTRIAVAPGSLTLAT